MSGGGSSGGLESYLPVAAALAATVMTDGAAAPALFGEGGALAGSTALGAGVAGAGIGALTGGGVAALMGQDVGRNMLMGGLGGAALGGSGLYMGAGGAGTGVVGDAAAYSGAMGPEYSGAQLAQMSPSTTANLASNASTAAGTSLIPGISNTTLGVGAGGIGLAALMAQEQQKYGTPPPSSIAYNGGNLSKFNYDPASYRPDVVRPPSPAYAPTYRNYATAPGYAGGGLLDPNSEPVDFMGGDMYPQSQQQRSYYATPTQMPTSAQQSLASYEPKTNPLTGEPTTGMAGGGLASLGSYSDGGQMLKGPGDGMSDSIPAKIGSHQPARLADNEFVVPADVVSHLGNGSSDAGAKKLYAMMNNVRKARTGKKKQAPKINADKYLPV